MLVVASIKDVVVRDLRKYRDERGWLSELFRKDDLEPEFFPVMAYISATLPGVTRGPHEHQDQADLFYFKHRQDPIDEIRHEDDPNTPFQMED